MLDGHLVVALGTPVVGGLLVDGVDVHVDPDGPQVLLDQLGLLGVGRADRQRDLERGAVGLVRRPSLLRSRRSIWSNSAPALALSKS